MRILLINVPHPAIGSRIPDDHLPPLGLLCVGGPFPIGPKLAPRRRRGANGSNFSILGKGKRVFHVDAKIAHRVLDLAMTEKDLDGPKVSDRPVDDRRLCSAK